MQQPHDNAWFLGDPSHGGPAHGQPPAGPNPNFPDPTPNYDFEPPTPQHQFPPPEAQSEPRGFPSPFDGGDSGDNERGTDRGLHLPFHHSKPENPPPPYRNDPPSSGFRIPLASNAQFPPSNQVGPPVCKDADGVTPVFLGSAIFDDSVHPCKIVPSIRPPCRVAYGGGEREHHGRFDLLPITSDMEWVHTRDGKIPSGRRPVEGGYESDGAKLYHALGKVDRTEVPGKTGGHLAGANLPFGGYEQIVREYKILCWK